MIPDLGRGRQTTLVRKSRRSLTVFVGAVLVLYALASAEAAETGDLQRLRERALELVNAERKKRSLTPLQLGEDLNEAALAHARDMFERNYYAHASPEGDTVQDRYIAAGGSRWELVAENIARCTGCDPPPTIASVERLHEGWMNSLPHRENILAEGLKAFGFGIVVDDKQGLYAVQTFAGPGKPRGLEAGETAEALSDDAQRAAALELINRARRQAGVPALEASEALADAARGMLPSRDSESLRLQGDIYEALPAGQRAAWRAVSVLAGACGGCGTEPTRADIRAFRKQWMDHPQQHEVLLDPKFTHLGFALQTNGRGKKAAVAVLGHHR